MKNVRGWKILGVEKRLGDENISEVEKKSGVEKNQGLKNIWGWKNVSFWICFSKRFCHIFKNLKVTQIFWNFLKSTNIVNWINNKHSNNQNSNNKSKVIVNTHQVQNQITFFKFCRDWSEGGVEWIYPFYFPPNQWMKLNELSINGSNFTWHAFDLMPLWR